MASDETASVVPLQEKSVTPIFPAFVVGLLRIADLSAIVLSGALIYWIYLLPEHYGDFDRYLAVTLIGAATASLLFQWTKVYEKAKAFPKTLYIRRTLSAWTISFAILLTAAFALKISGTYSRVWATTWFLSVAALLSLSRYALSSCISRWIRQGRLFTRTVIVGAGEQGQRLAASISRRQDARSLILGFIDDRKSRIPTSISEHEVLGDLDHLVQLVRGNRVDQVFIALPWSADDRIAEILYRLSLMPVRIQLAPDLAGLTFSGRTLTETDGFPMLSLLDRPISGWSYVWKSLEDRILCTLLLALLGPLMLLIALAIKLDSDGPVIFRQKRYGFNDQLIEVWKFRTMHMHATDLDAETLVTRDDARVTRIGRLLRRLSLDELPQFFNVLRGDMSLVGPRPHALSAKAEGRRYQEVVDRYAARHRVKPGITGWAQVNGWRGETDTIEKIQKRVEHDLYYIDNWSVWLDIRIIFKTILAILSSKEAY